ncbi:MAG TPA: flagellar biosynthesis protein FlhA [Acidimicrobiales bacterium]|nr:flagellar biosynthesis protein FlhA [Acidimicrobiales bacterium]
MKRNRIGMIGIPAGVVAIVVMLIVPMPSFILDILISMNIAGAVIVLLMSMHVQKPLDFSVFPSLLLVATMFRLALNVSATRLILLHGSAGTVIHSFGSFVVGGSLVVGLVVFLILIVIQFVVVTSGAGRVAEVAARFTLDAMPGKQMAIDADLNSGAITETEAKQRRREIANEADFYGAMDGASKFVRGDAIAAVVITAINLLGGFAVGMAQQHLSASAAVHTYSLLSVGDGLVSQIPALLLSISTGLVVTRAATEEDFGSDVVSQVKRQHRAVQVAGVVILLLAFVPGLPHIAFLVVGGLLYFVSVRIRNAATVETPAEEVPIALEVDSPQALAGEIRVDALELELSLDLIDLVDAAKGGDLLERVKGLRRKIAGDLGLIVPPVRTRDNLDLGPGTYVIRLHGVEMGRGQAPPGRLLAIGDGLAGLPGEATVEPVFGLAARWVPAELRQQAIIAGATVVGRSSVITTHLGEVVADNAGRLLSAQQLRTLLDLVKEREPVVMEEMAAAQVGPGELQRVLCDLLDEGVPIRDLARITEAVSERARTSKDPEALLEAARVALGPAITALYASDGTLAVITIDAVDERVLVDSVSPSDHGTVLAVEPARAESLAEQVKVLAEQAEEHGRRPVLLCSSRLRSAAQRLLRGPVPRLGVLAVNEVGPHVQLERIGTVHLADAIAAV